jgi:putative peptidoglycan lipid II flippase
MIGASITMGLVLWGLKALLFQAPAHGWLRLASLAGLVGGGMVTYIFAAFLLGAYDPRSLGQMISRRRLRRKGGSAISSAPTTET